ncbi:MAG: hypothetical protein D8M62_12720 [Proteobacteria bacterium]|nr:hypothetical protein [Pseudomonadota bacterium]
MVSSQELKDGKFAKLYVPVSKIVSAPRWDPVSNKTIISISEAAMFFKEWAEINLNDYEAKIVHTIQATKFSCWSGEYGKYKNNGDYWFYIIQYHALTFEPRNVKEGNILALLMSGEIIEPIVEDYY